MAIIMGICGGLALFLYGMEKMSNGLKKSTGVKIRQILSIVTDNRLIALFVGTFVTMILQSSSAVTVMLVSFVQAGLMNFVQTLGILLGASIGTTITAQLVAFKLTEFSLIFVALGFMMTVMSKKENVRYLGEVIFGFGILFFGMKLMSDSMAPLKSYPHVLNILKDLENPFYGVLFGMIFTALIQSSSAFLGIVILLSQKGMIGLHAGVPLVIGTNIGTCITALLASIGASREAKRVAIAHTLFKVAGAFIFIFWIPLFADLVTSLNFGMDLSEGRLIANAHTLYNVGLALLFLPFTHLLARFLFYLYPEVKEKYPVVMETRFLDDNVLHTPVMAINLARSEISRMAGVIKEMMAAIMRPLAIKSMPKDPKYRRLTLIEGITTREAKVNFLEQKISEYLMKISQKELSDEQANETFVLITISKDLESIADIINKNILPQIEKKRELDFGFSREGMEELQIYHTKISKQISRAHAAFSELDPVKAEKIMKKFQKYLQLESEYVFSHLKRVGKARPESVESHRVHVEILDALKQINVYASNIAKLILTL